MLFRVKDLSKYWGIKPDGVIHLGAHEAEELDDYNVAGWLPIIWVEGQEILARKLSTRLDPEYHTVIQAYAWSEETRLTFKITDNSQSSSLLNMGTHSTDYPSVNVVEEITVLTSRVDSLIQLSEMRSFLNLDLQGAELEALKGMGDLLNHANWIYSEVNSKEVYKGCARIEHLDVFLQEKNFRRIATRWVTGKGWGDALYIRKGIKTPSKYVLHRNLSNLSWIIESRLTQFKSILRSLLNGK
jgi:FkbM family methyltransferase